MKPGRTVEMTGAWKTRKTKTRFPFVSHGPWKSLRDCHIPTAPARRGKVENQRQVSHFPTCCFCPKSIKKGDPRGGSLHSPPSGSFFNEKMLPRRGRKPPKTGPTVSKSHQLGRLVSKLRLLSFASRFICLVLL